MVGNYRKNKEKYQQYLKCWLNNAIEKRLWLKYEDLHIDNVDPIFSDHDVWITGGIFLLDCLWIIMNKSKYDCILGMELSETTHPTDIKLVDLNYLKKSLSVSPPSLYVFPKDEIAYKQTLSVSYYLSDLSNALDLNVYFREISDGIESFSRFVYFKPK